VDVGITFLLEVGPVELGSVLNREAVIIGIMNAFCEVSSIPGNFLWYTAGTEKY